MSAQRAPPLWDASDSCRATRACTVDGTRRSRLRPRRARGHMIRIWGGLPGETRRRARHQAQTQSARGRRGDHRRRARRPHPARCASCGARAGLRAAARRARGAARPQACAPACPARGGGGRRRRSAGSTDIAGPGPAATGARRVWACAAFRARAARSSDSVSAAPRGSPTFACAATLAAPGSALCSAAAAHVDALSSVAALDGSSRSPSATTAP